MKWKWVDKASGIDRLICVGLDYLAAKHCYFGCSKPSDVDGIKTFDKVIEQYRKLLKMWITTN